MGWPDDPHSLLVLNDVIPQFHTSLMSLRAILIDLDNTLVLYDEPAFHQQYFESLSRSFADWWDPRTFVHRLLRATFGLRKNGGTRSNAERFLDDFLGETDYGRESAWDRFDRFYKVDYPKLETRAEVPPGLTETLDTLRARGYHLALATNPVYPLDAIAVRLGWSGLSLDRFDAITDIESTSSVKPDEGYFTEVARQLGASPDDCLMVGNDAYHDLAASRVGMKTYLTTEAMVVDYSAHPDNYEDAFHPDGSGTLAEVIPFIDKLST